MNSFQIIWQTFSKRNISLRKIKFIYIYKKNRHQSNLIHINPNRYLDVASFQVHSESIRFQSGCMYSCVFMEIRTVRKSWQKKSPGEYERQTFRKPEINIRSDGVETHVVLSVRRSRQRFIPSRCCPLWARVPLENEILKKGFHSFEIVFQPRGSGAYKQVHSQNSLLWSIVAFVLDYGLLLEVFPVEKTL